MLPSYLRMDLMRTLCHAFSHGNPTPKQSLLKTQVMPVYGITAQDDGNQIGETSCFTPLMG